VEPCALGLERGETCVKENRPGSLDYLKVPASIAVFGNPDEFLAATRLVPLATFGARGAFCSSARAYAFSMASVGQTAAHCGSSK